MNEQLKQSKKVLVVDDEPVVCRVIQETLKRNGFDVITETKSLKTPSCIQAIYPDLVIMDIKMPKLDGLTLCKTIKNSQRNSCVPVLIMTALQDTIYETKAYNAGASSFIQKPFDLNNLINKVKTLVDK